MKQICMSLLLGASLAMHAAPPPPLNPVTTTVTTETSAILAYENGFAYNVMRSRDGQGVMLNDMALIENDGPGAGQSEKGCWQEALSQGVLVRKTFELADPAAWQAHLVLFMTPQSQDLTKQAPFFVEFNGTRLTSPPLSWHEPMWHWLEIPVSLLRRGQNVAVVGCDAPAGQGYDLLLARADEYDRGGGARSVDGNTALLSAGQLDACADGRRREVQTFDVGRTSAKSLDGGKTWIENRLGTTNDVVGEYTIRLNLRRFAPQGALLAGPLDLWDGVPGHDVLKVPCAVSEAKLVCQGEQPPGTALVWQARWADTSDMLAPAWGEFVTLGEGATLTATLNPGAKRYLQWRALLRTADRLKTPVVREVRLGRSLTCTPPSNRFYVWQCENVRQRYSSVRFACEKWDEPKLRTLRERLELDKILATATTDWEKINLLRYHISRQWYHGDPVPGYPEWDALEILDRRDRVGKGGMCIQFSIVFVQALLAMGYQARHVNIFSHETVEVYVDELERWVHVDPESLFDSYEYETGGGMPLNCLDQHRYFLEENGLSAEKPIDWKALTPWARYGNPDKVFGKSVPLDFSTFTGWINDPSKKDYPPQHALVGFMRMMPRNDYFSRPVPRPLTQGMVHWPWNGYVNWYDAATPRKLQYALHTDREIDFYPTLNRVEFDAVHTEKEGDLTVRMVTVAPNSGGFEVNIDGTGWRPAAAEFIWSLKRAALNTLEMRVRNRLGPIGKPSRLQVMYHYKAPYAPQEKAAK